MHAAQCSTIASVTIKPVEARPTRFGWLNPFLVVLLGTVVVAFLLAAPIRIGPGDHEKNTKACFISRSQPLGDDGDGQDGLEADCELVVSSGDAAVAFETVDAVLDGVA